MNALSRWWHRRRVERLTRELALQTERCRMLDTAADNFCSSYYTDRAIEATCQRFRINSTLRYHQDKLST